MAYEEISKTGKRRWIPDTFISMTNNDNLDVGYIYNGKQGTVIAIFYTGNSASITFHNSFSDIASAQKAIDNTFAILANRKITMKNRRSERNAGHNFKVGDIVVNTWGYDQTNVDAYRVVNTTKNFVSLQEIGGTTVDTGFMSGNFTPNVTDMGSGEITRHSAHGDYVNMQHGCGNLWLGGAVSCSWGH